MISIPKVISVMSCGVLMCLGLSHAAQADNAASVQEEMKAEQTDRRQGGQEVGEKQMSDEIKGEQSKTGKTIKGEVLRIEGDTYLVKGQDGKEVRLRTDNTTRKSGVISQGDRIEANVNEQNLALSIRSAQGREAGHGNESGRMLDSTNKSDTTGSTGY
ncbi:MAG: hypothetical protein SGJ26_08850 [Nitrospirota bacterium]|nr:hypothetical protein [Nitrospirota bacterium]